MRGPVVHATPQQSAGVPGVVASQPFAVDPSQFALPATHDAMVQFPPLHPPIATPWSVQSFVHAPQRVLVSTAVSQPFARFPSQSPKPDLQAP